MITIVQDHTRGDDINQNSLSVRFSIFSGHSLVTIVNSPAMFKLRIFRRHPSGEPCCILGQLIWHYTIEVYLVGVAIKSCKDCAALSLICNNLSNFVSQTFKKSSS
jgi:hypothetical protein